MYVFHIFVIIFCQLYTTSTGGNPPSWLDFSRSDGALTFFALRQVEFVSKFRNISRNNLVRCAVKVLM